MGTPSEWAYLRRVYDGAKERCNNPHHISFKYYGLRGIQFKFKNFNEFCMELGHRPPRTSLDRINVNRHYEVGNVRWATAEIQSTNNRRIPQGISNIFGVTTRKSTKTHPYTRYIVRVTDTESRQRVILYIGRDLSLATQIANDYYNKKEAA